MDKELLKKEALKYANENVRYPGELTYPSEMDDMIESFADAFKDGAKWRINSVWHANTEMPDVGTNEYGCGKDCLVKPIRGIVELAQALRARDRFVFAGQRDTYTMDEVESWAYVDDLLPERKEMTED